MMKTKLEKSEQKQKQEKRILTKLSKHSLLVGTSRENVDFGREDVGPGIIQKDKSEESTPERICHSDKLSENERNIKPICFNQIADEESKFEDKHDFESKNITKDNEHNIEESKELDYQEEEEEENEAEDDLENDQVYIEEDDDENDDFEIQLQQKELESKQKQK